MPASVTASRVLGTVAGAVALVVGIADLGPWASDGLPFVGWTLLAASALFWVGVILQRRHLRSGRWWVRSATVAALTAGVIELLVGGGLAGFVAAALGLASVILALLPASDRRWSPTAFSARRLGGAVGVTVIALAGIAAVGAAAAAAPCSFPRVSASGLDVSSTGPSSGEGMRPSGTARATDGTRLAYYAFTPAHPVASLVFFHGSGANSTLGYLGFGHDLAQSGVAAYLFDVRGHGASGGPRGDTPSPGQLVSDVSTAVHVALLAQPGLPVFVGGHSAGAGIVLNSVASLGSRVRGYVLIAPDFGLHSGTESVADASNFAAVCQPPLIAATLSNGLVDAHRDAVAFAYTPAQIRSGLIPRYTAAMAIGQNVTDARGILSNLRHPVGVWIGSHDEVFSPARVTAFAQAAPHRLLTTTIVPGATHLSVLDDVGRDVGQWIRSQARVGDE
jgi:alpha-beta hydrolase superfamily lysophospholipase